MSKNMTEAMEARIRKFISESIDKDHELWDRGDFVSKDCRAALEQWCIEHWPEDPDTELMREVVGLLNDVRARTGRECHVRMGYVGLWNIIERDPSDGRWSDVDEAGGLRAFNLEQLRDKLKSMLPPPVPTCEKAAEAAKEIETLYRLSNRVKAGSEAEQKFQSVAAYFADAIKQQAAEGEGGE